MCPPCFFIELGGDGIQTSKYNVSRDVEKRSYGGHVFDSVMEMRFFRDVILPQVESGQILKYELQKPYELQPKFEHCGKSVRPITYVADFYIEYSDGHAEVIDTKGAADSVAKMKRKMMWYTYPEVVYKWITYVKKWGGWLDWEEVNRLRKEAKREKRTKREEEDTHE